MIIRHLQIFAGLVIKFLQISCDILPPHHLQACPVGTLPSNTIATALEESVMAYKDVYESWKSDPEAHWMKAAAGSMPSISIL